MQYEDATDNIQTIREKLELERAAKLEWLRSAAAACARSFSGAANGHAQVGILVAASRADTAVPMNSDTCIASARHCSVWECCHVMAGSVLAFTVLNVTMIS